MSAICLSVSSRRFRTDTVAVVGSSVDDMDVPETVVSAVVELSVDDNELLVNLTIVESLVLPIVVLWVDAIGVESLVVLETDVLILSVDVLLMVVIPLVVLPIVLLVSVVLSTEVLLVVLLMVDVPSVELLVVPSVVGLPTDVLVAVVLPSSVLSSVVLLSVVLPSVVLPGVVLPCVVLPSVVLPSVVLPSVVLPIVVLPSVVICSVVTVVPAKVVPKVVSELAAAVERAGQELGSTEAPASADRAKQYSSSVCSESPLLVYTQPSTQLGSGLSTSSTFSRYSPFKFAKVPSAFCNLGWKLIRYLHIILDILKNFLITWTRTVRQQPWPSGVRVTSARRGRQPVIVTKNSRNPPE